MIQSPYKGVPVEEWPKVSASLVSEHPLQKEEIVEVVLKVWSDIFKSSLGSKPFYIGRDIFPKPQIMGVLLHELIPLELMERHTGFWRSDKKTDEKDLIYIPDNKYSMEIKTSSSVKGIFGNRSYAQKAKSIKKSKSGYYLAINFQKFEENLRTPKITLIRFGWIDHEDWIGQKAPTGQQSRLNKDVMEVKLVRLYSLK